MAVLAAEINDGADFTYIDSDYLTIGTISESGTANLPEKVGVVASGGNGSITIKTQDGTMAVDANVKAVGTGSISLQTQGQAKDLIIRSAVKSGTGNIVLTATGFVAQAEMGNISTSSPGKVTSNSGEQTPDGLKLDLSGQFSCGEVATTR